MFIVEKNRRLDEVSVVSEDGERVAVFDLDNTAGRTAWRLFEEALADQIAYQPGAFAQVHAMFQDA